MAVLPSCPGLTVDIVVNGEPLPEYDNNKGAPEAPKTITKYVEARPDIEFALRFRFTKPFLRDRDVGYKVYVDGTLIDSSYVSRFSLYKVAGEEVNALKSKVGAKWVKRKLRFSKLSISNGHHPGMSNDFLKSLASIGTVTVVFEYGTARLLASEAFGSRTFSSRDMVPEEAIKGDAKSYQVSLGEAKDARPVKKVSWWGEESEFATFNFKYRSLADLKALHIVPRTPSPSPGPEESVSLAGGIDRSTTAAQDEFDGVTKEDLIMVIEEYRGTSKGLQALNRTELLAMLKRYRGKMKTTVKRRRGIDIKHEDEDEVTVLESRSRKRRCGPGDELIVLD